MFLTIAFLAFVFLVVLDVCVTLSVRRGSVVVGLVAVELALVVLLVLRLDDVVRVLDPPVLPFEVLEVRQLVAWMKHYNRRSAMRASNKFRHNKPIAMRYTIEPSVSE